MTNLGSVDFLIIVMLTRLLLFVTSGAKDVIVTENNNIMTYTVTSSIK